MDILLQYLNIRRQKQAFVKVSNLNCNTIYQVINHECMVDRAVSFIDHLGSVFNSSFLFVGIIDAQYCNRKTITELSYSDFCRITSGLGEASSID